MRRDAPAGQVVGVLLCPERIEDIIEGVFAPLSPEGDGDPPHRLADVHLSDCQVCCVINLFFVNISGKPRRNVSRYRVARSNVSVTFLIPLTLLEIVECGADHDLQFLGSVALVKVEIHVERDGRDRLPP